MSSLPFLFDHERESRTGLDEAIYCEGKAIEHLRGLLTRSGKRRLLLTRLTVEQYRALPRAQQKSLDFDPLSRTAFRGAPRPTSRGAPRIALVSAGTSDAPICGEAARTLTWLGLPVTRVEDVGVAGLWRLTARLELLRAHAVLIVVAGFDAALPTIVAGLVPGAIIAVPTSIGYGVARGGKAALNAILASCAPGVTTVNIDNGYGAACAAARILFSADAPQRRRTSAERGQE